eukprot:6182991-Prorocentrum_lima.AAC.1
MTSSLVGSEMCIRDSEEEDQLAWLTAGNLPSPGCCCVGQVQNHNKDYNCLLYTSDAADDM